MNRTVNVVRLQLVNKMTYIWIPLIILVGAWVLTLAIYAMLSGNGAPGPFYGGGSQAPLWYFLVVGIQALTFTFPFSQAMSITRREFYLGTLLTAALTAAILSTVFLLGGFIEIATRGYGMDGYFFRIDALWAAGWWVAWLAYFAIAMLMFVVGFWAATIYKRWGTIAITVVLVGLGLLLVGAMADRPLGRLGRSVRLVRRAGCTRTHAVGHSADRAARGHVLSDSAARGSLTWMTDAVAPAFAGRRHPSLEVSAQRHLDVGAALVGHPRPHLHQARLIDEAAGEQRLPLQEGRRALQQ